MKPLKAIHILFAGAILLPVSFSVAEPKFAEGIMLEHLDFFENYGNQGVEIDEENLRLMFLHQDAKIGVHSYKSYRLEVVEPEVKETVEHEQISFKHDLVEFHLIPEQHNELTKSLKDFVTYDTSKQEIDWKKAYKQFTKMSVPKKYRQQVKGGMHITLKYERHNIRFTQLSKESSETDRDVVTRIEYLEIIEGTDGSMVFKIETFVPEKPLDAKLIFNWEKYWPANVDDDSTEQNKNDEQEPQANTDSDSSLLIGRTIVNGSGYFPWSKFGGLLETDVGFSITRTDNPNNETCRVTSYFEVGATFSRWIDKLLTEDFTADIELVNEIWYQENESANEERLDRETNMTTVTGGWHDPEDPHENPPHDSPERRTAHVATNATGDTEDIYGIIGVSLLLDVDTEIDVPVIPGTGIFSKFVPRGIDLDRPGGVNVRIWLDKDGKDSAEVDHRIILLSGVRTKYIF